MNDLVSRDKEFIWHPYTQSFTAPDPIPVRSGKGAWLTLEDGSQVLDCISSWWVTLFGHCQPEISRAIAKQAETLEQVIFAGFTHAPAVGLAEKLSAVMPDDLNRTFFTDNGSTAVEMAMKTAYQYMRNKGMENRTRFLALEGGYHGDTFGAMSASKSSGFFPAWEDLFFDVDLIPCPHTFMGDADVEAKEQQAITQLDHFLEQYGDETCALLLEPLVQGASGMRMMRPEFIKTISEKVRACGILVIYDEVMTGFGRTGALFALKHIGFTPDLVTLSKGISAGFLPLGATVVRDEIYEAFLGDTFEQALSHGHSYTANPISCAAACASLDLLQTQSIQKQISMIGKTHQDFLENDDVLRSADIAVELRCQGTIAALNLKVDDAGYTAQIGQDLKKRYIENGYLIRPLGNVIYLLPPYCITQEELVSAWTEISDSLKDIA